MTLAYTLEEAERDLRNVYWMIRATRVRNWKHVNKARAITTAMKLMGVKRWELINAMYCLKNINCSRCDKNKYGLACYEIGKRREQAEKLKCDE